VIVTLQVALLQRFRAQCLHHGHHFGLLCEKRIAKLLHPVDFRIHRLQHIRKSSECLNAWIPLLLERLGRERFALEGRILLHPAISLYYFKRVG
jgi:hypothetical protein